MRYGRLLSCGMAVVESGEGLQLNDYFPIGIQTLVQYVQGHDDADYCGAYYAEGDQEFFLFSCGEKPEILDLVFEIENFIYNERSELIELYAVHHALQACHLFQSARRMAQIEGRVLIHIRIIGIGDKAVAARAFYLYGSLVYGEPQFGPA